MRRPLHHPCMQGGGRAGTGGVVALTLASPGAPDAPGTDSVEGVSPAPCSPVGKSRVQIGRLIWDRVGACRDGPAGAADGGG